MPNFQPRDKKTGIIVTALCTLLMIVLLVTACACVLVYLCINKEDADHWNRRYVIVMDAGSTHTGIFVYLCQNSTTHSTGFQVRLIGAAECEAKGLTNAKSYSHISDRMRRCIKYAAGKIPGEYHPATEFYVGATGGIRLLLSRDSHAANGLLDSIRREIKNCTRFHLEPHHIHVLTGTYEGFYAWIAANYMANNFQQGINLTDDRFFGILQLGGASSQFTFHSDVYSDNSYSPSINTNIFGEDLWIYSDSYLCYGQKEASRIFYAMLAHEQNSSDILNPCAPIGSTFGRSADKYFGHQCTVRFNTRSGGNITSWGTSQPDDCREAVRRVLNVAGYAAPDPVNRTISGKFLAFSGYYWTASMYGFLSNRTDPILRNISLEDFRYTTWLHCRKTVERVRLLLPQLPTGPEEDPRAVDALGSFCLDATLMDVLLTEVYGFDAESFSNLIFTNGIKGVPLGWTLGMAIHVTQTEPSSLITWADEQVLIRPGLVANSTRPER